MDKSNQVKLSDNVALALTSVSNRFTCHYMKGDISESIHIISNDSYSYCRIHWFHDDNTAVYLGWLSVSDEVRKEGRGLELQLIREDMGRKLGAKKSILWVDKDSWMREWYERRGYKSLKPNPKQKNAIWMHKLLGG